jgi:hypothetical protein
MKQSINIRCTQHCLYFESDSKLLKQPHIIVCFSVLSISSAFTISTYFIPGISIHMNQRTISTWDQLIKVKGKGNAVLKCPLLDSGDIQETLLVQ